MCAGQLHQQITDTTGSAGDENPLTVEVTCNPNQPQGNHARQRQCRRGRRIHCLG